MSWTFKAEAKKIVRKATPRGLHHCVLTVGCLMWTTSSRGHYSWIGTNLIHGKKCAIAQ